MVDQVDAAVVRMIYDFYLGADGPPMGIKAITCHLNARGIMIRGRPFNVAMVHKILTRTTYKGVHYFDQKDSRTGQWKDRAQWVPMQVPTIIDPERFDRVQATLKARQPRVTPPASLTSRLSSPA